jgi:cysteine-rich repeat protein
MQLGNLGKWIAALALIGLGASPLGCGDEGSSLTCGAGTTEANGVCTAQLGDITCGDGTVNSGGECVPEDAYPCGAGTTESNGECVPTGSGIVCGEGTVEQAGECVPDVDGPTCGAGTTLVDNTCLPSPVCGNGRVETGEECDDGNTDDGDSCSAACVSTPVDGESCANPIDLDTISARPISVTGSTAALNDDFDGLASCALHAGPLASTGAGSDLVYSLTVPTDLAILVSLTTPQHDGTVAVLTDCSNPTVATCAAASDPEPTQIAHINTSGADQKVFIVVDGLFGEEGDFTLEVAFADVECTPGASCDDGDLCTSNDVCDAAGKCVGEAKTCDDNNSCTDDSCEASTGTCRHLAMGGRFCDDGNACNRFDRCDNTGMCVGLGGDCDDGNACTDDVCIAATGCSNTPNTAACDDGNSCTDQDMCSGGVCMAGGTNTCTCTTDADCASSEDGDLCNGTLVCQNNECVIDPATVVNCPVAGECKQSSCQPNTGFCFIENQTDGTFCDDGYAHNGPDVCTAGVCG